MPDESPGNVQIDSTPSVYPNYGMFPWEEDGFWAM